MNALTAALKEELNVDMVTVFGLSIPESVVVSWGIMAFLVIVSILLTRNLRVDHITKRQAILETVVTTINDFFVGLLGESGKRYVPYLMSVALYIGCSNLIGVFGIKPPTKDLNVTAALALMSICLIEYAGIHARGGVGFLKRLAGPAREVGAGDEGGVAGEAASRGGGRGGRPGGARRCGGCGQMTRWHSMYSNVGSAREIWSGSASATPSVAAAVRFR